MPSTDPSTLLRRALWGNAIFSTATGVLLLLAGGVLGPFLGIPAMALRIVGLVLLPFAFGLWRNSARPAVHRGEAWAAVVLDLGWVGGSAALVAFGLWPMTAAGTWAVIGVADVVLVCALAQALGLVKSHRVMTLGH